MPNVSMSAMSIRQAVWQTYISRAGKEAAVPLERVARGQRVASVLREFSEQIEPEVFHRLDGRLRWQFMRTAGPQDLLIHSA